MSEPSAKQTGRGVLRRVEDLVEAGLVDSSDREALGRVLDRFTLAVTPDLVELIHPDDRADPIARQFIPSSRELQVLSEELPDPIGDGPHTPLKGITHRYPDRLLLKPVHVCPAYCRFCFRREKVGHSAEVLSRDDLAAAFDYIRAHQEVWEVILSGGDPLILPPSRLAELVQVLDGIAHVKLIRIHTRTPVLDPERVVPAMVRALKGSKTVFVVLHCNHPRELTEKVRAACSLFVDAGIPMLGQTVLLRGINDDVAVLEQLFRELTVLRVKPYYLHHGDLAQGTSHFRTSIAEGQALVRGMRGRLSGICQPVYVLDIPGGHGKVPIGPVYLSEEDAEGRRRVEDPSGQVHLYPPERAF